MSTLDTTLSFLTLIHRFQKVTRTIPALGRDDDENDLEHSYVLAMTSWYLVDILSPDLNKDLVIKYALVHDLVEAYAGDTYVYTTDDALKGSKHEREESARLQIEKEFPEFGDLHQLIREYEEKKTPESRFVYALDKIIPVLTIYLGSKERESYWKKHKIHFEMLHENKTEKIALSPETEKLWHEVRAFLETQKDELFVPPPTPEA